MGVIWLLPALGYLLAGGNAGAVTRSRCGPFDNSTLVDNCVCSVELCVRKCCLADQVLKTVKTGNVKWQCVFNTTVADLWTLPTFGDLTELQKAANASDMHIVHGFPQGTYFFLEVGESFNVSRDGFLFAKDVTAKTTSEFCLEYVLDDDRVLPAISISASQMDETSAVGRHNSDTAFAETLAHHKTIIVRYGLLVSIMFMLITVFTYMLIPSLLNLHGKSLLCHVSSLTIADAGMYVVASNTRMSQEVCELSAFIIQFSFLASFFWLNIMCFDLWWTFSGYRSFNGSPRERDFKKFLVYCLYAWGCPTLIVAATVFTQYYPGLPAYIITPDFGVSKCWFHTNNATFVYFYSFISIILISNLCMFISTALTLKKHKKEAKVFKRTGSRRHLDHDKQRFNLYLKLFIVMGVNWMMEAISFYLPELQYVWVLSDIGNSLQGVLIFLIFVCKRRVLALLNMKLCPCYIFITNTRNRTVSQSTLSSSIASVRPPGSICKNSVKIGMDTMPNGTGSKTDFAV